MCEFAALLAQESEPFIKLIEPDNSVSFPNLGILFNNVSVGVKIGPFSIRWYGLIICLAMVLCIILGMRRTSSYGISKDDLFDYILFGIPSAIIGARAYYVLFSLDYYKAHPGEIFAIWNGGLAIYGGVIAIAIMALVATKIKKKSFIHLMDFVLPYVILGQGIGRWGNFVNQEAYGANTTSVFGMTGNLIAGEVGNDVLVHPTFLYESLWCLAGFVFIAIYRKKLQKNIGEATALYLMIYGTERAIVEGLRTDSLMVHIGDFGIRVSQWLSVALVVIGIALFIDARLRGKPLAGVVSEFRKNEAAKLLDAKKKKEVEEPAEEAEKSSFAEVVEAMTLDEEGGSEEDGTEEEDEPEEPEETEVSTEPEEPTETEEAAEPDPVKPEEV
ncbi:MAG: prolipoprotein diacylglyceryl transferase [Clostridia bacterium]|nr:prolipoprotein diacylglyceryl transferase [Clostridia bacterium]